MLERDTRTAAALNVLVVLSVLLAAGSVGYAVTVPHDGEQFSAIYLLTEEDDGELVADNYPTAFVQGEQKEVTVGIDNHEQETTEYTVVVLEQDVDRVETEPTTGEGEANTTMNETVVREQRELDRLSTTISHNASWHNEYDLEPTLAGENQRIVWLLFPDGEVPSDPSLADTEYSVYLWADVAEK